MFHFGIERLFQGKRFHTMFIRDEERIKTVLGPADKRFGNTIYTQFSFELQGNTVKSNPEY